MDHQILIDAEVAVPQGLEEGLRRVITAALAAEGVALPCEISVLLTDDAGIRQINADMRDIDRATDVLSFPMFELTPGEPPEDEEDLDGAVSPGGYVHLPGAGGGPGPGVWPQPGAGGELSGGPLGAPPAGL